MDTKHWRRLGIIAGLAIIIFGFILTPAIISGQSMEPHYHDGAFTLINRLTYLNREPGRGEIVAIKIAGRRLMYLKRVIGLPGETVSIVKGQVMLGGEILIEPYVLSPHPWDYEPITLAPDEYFIIGDNRRQSVSEHVFGRVQLKQVVGAPLW